MVKRKRDDSSTSLHNTSADSKRPNEGLISSSNAHGPLVLLQTSPRGAFHPFSRLPKELRWMIWDHSLVPRVVDAEISDRSNRVISKAKMPAAFSVNKESRAYSIPKYLKIFYDGEYSSLSRPVIGLQEIIYFNPHIDTLYLPFPNSPLNPGGILSSNTVSGKFNGFFFLRRVRKKGFENFYSQKIKEVLSMGSPAIYRVENAEVDNLYRGSLIYGIPRPPQIAQETYDLSITFPKLKKLVFRCSWARFPDLKLANLLPYRDREYMDQMEMRWKEYSHYDLVHERLTEAALERKHEQVNREGEVLVMFKEVPAIKGYFLQLGENGFLLDYLSGGPHRPLPRRGQRLPLREERSRPHSMIIAKGWVRFREPER